MEAKEEITVSNATVKATEAPGSYSVDPVNSKSNPNPNPTTAPSNGPTVTSIPATALTAELLKKKRGRPRKYGPDGVVANALSPMPISASVPLTRGEFSMWRPNGGRGRPLESMQKTPKFESFEPAGERISYQVGTSFMPHVITVNAGEDITMKIMSFSQQGACAICVLSATGTVSNVTLRQPTASGGTLTYEGHFEILSLTGSYMLSEIGGTKSRSGGMSISLAGPDGHIIGGGLAGLLIAAGSVQVVVGSFLPGHQLEAKQKKQKNEPTAPIAPTTVTVLTAEDLKGLYKGVKPIPIPSPSFPANGSPSLNPAQVLTNLSDDNKSSSLEEHPNGEEHSNSEVSC